MALEDFAPKPDDMDVSDFVDLVRQQRFVATLLSHRINSYSALYKVDTLLSWTKLRFLRVQGLAVCLSKAKEDDYSMQTLFQLAAVRTQLRLFWDCTFEDSWYDAWFEKYPVSGSIEHTSLNIDYTRREREEAEEVDALAKQLARLSLQD
ncbi:hypothetical protein F53441_5844 [Fusarium austroafricanum]|uniref:Uncharacterized protein n=1 Tax=Fusarium austroafricanum TaxID=2364996 RepID=A0A8H4KJ93_9HYPO|nr:hypothetical protein F53441_5844 [Fusarium austroafricanum]